jgi:hypothetical protein
MVFAALIRTKGYHSKLPSERRNYSQHYPIPTPRTLFSPFSLRVMSLWELNLTGTNTRNSPPTTQVTDGQTIRTRLSPSRVGPALPRWKYPATCKSSYVRLTLRELLFISVIGLQSIALVVSILARSNDAALRCNCSHNDSPLLYCRWGSRNAWWWCNWPHSAVAPAQVAVEYEVKAFTLGQDEKTRYQGLLDDVDWS